MHLYFDNSPPKGRDEKIDNLAVLKRLIPYFKDFKREVFLSVLLLVFAVIFSLTLPLLLKHIIDISIPQQNFKDLLFFALLYILLFSTSKLLSYLETVIISKVGLSIVKNFKSNLFSHILNQSITFFKEYTPGKLLQRIENDGENLKQLFSNVSTNILRELVTIAGIFFVLFANDFIISLYILGISLSLLLLTQYFIKSNKKYFQKSRKCYADITGFVTEYVQGVPSIQMMNGEDYIVKKLKEKNETRYKNDSRMYFLEYSFWAFILFIEVFVVILILSIGGKKLINGSMTIGSFIIFIEYTRMIFKPIVHFSEYINTIQKSFVSATRIFNLMDSSSIILDPIYPKRIKALQKGLEFKDVSFEYNKGQEVLKKISFKVPKGKIVALVGHTGAGKSTIVNLVMRFYDPCEGKILLDDIDIREITQNALRGKIGLVLQDNYLFYGSILDNIRVFNTGIKTDDVIRSAKIVRAADFIEKLPGGYDSNLIERGQNISLGERQLIGFARALAVDPEILLLDEATSSVDLHTEKLIEEGLSNLLAGKTALIIAHRLSTILKADNIIVLKDGEIAEEGNHNTLLAKNGIYREMYELQEFVRL